MYLPEFNYHQPSSLKDALAILSGSGNAALMAGGTDLLVEMKKGLRRHSDLVSLVRIPELKDIRTDEHNIYVGSGVTHNTIIANDSIGEILPVLVEAVSKIGSEQVRNIGTIGGNLCTAASCCDTAPVLLSLDASVEIMNHEGVRTIPLKDFFVFNKKTVLVKGDILTKIIIPRPAAGTGAAYEKFGLREAGAIAVVSVAVFIELKEHVVANASVVIGAVAPTPRISGNASAALIGKDISELLDNPVLIEAAGNAAVTDSIPIDDIRGGAQYRRDVLKVLTVRAAKTAIGRAAF